MRPSLALALASLGSTVHSLTFEQREPKSYIGDITNVSGIGPREISLVSKNDALVLTIGTDLSKEIMDTARANCQDPESQACKTEMRNVMGIGPSNDGVQRRSIEIVAAGGLVIAYVYYKLLTHTWGAMDEDNFQVVEINLPNDQRQGLAEWDPEEYKFEYKPFGKDPVEVYIDGTLPEPPTNPPGTIKEADGSITIFLPGLVTPIQDEFRKVICKRDSLTKRVTPSCLVKFAEAIMRIAQIGGPAQDIQFISPTDFPEPVDKNYLLIEALKRIRDSEDMMIFGDNLDQEARREIADFATWTAFSVTVGGFAFNDDSVRVSPGFLKRQGVESDDDDESKCPEQRLTPFCVNCGGNAIPHNYETLTGVCGGFGKELTYKGCKCWLPNPNRGFRVQHDDLVASYQLLNSLPDQEEEPEDPPQEPVDELRCTDPNDSPGAYISQGAMERHADAFCDGLTFPIESDYQVDTESEYETDTYDGAYLSLKSDTFVMVEECKRRFYSIINDCIPGENNPLNWKFGGEYEVDGSLYKINIAGPAVNRFVETDGGPMHSIRAKCQGSKGSFNDAFYIRGAGWENSDFGKELITKLRECMGSNPTNWEFDYFDNPDSDWLEWSAKGYTTIGQMDNCFGHAVRVSGGPTDATCEEIDCHSGPFQIVC